ncbi:glycerophosphodiester phosphodiesterase [Opitutaceae bacterium TAV5]|nr:glycerophosphodiester phosphodiesterase [Opitutaceae bacterium TAV5]
MHVLLRHLVRFLILTGSVFPALAQTGKPVVIAHRGASGYLPEHTLEAAAFAHALGADFIEQDVVMSRDDVPVVSHDIHIDTTTDVAAVFPDRRRADGRYYAVDFTWAELRSLRVRERFDPKTGLPVFPGRFPRNEATFRLCTMEEAILLVQGLNRATGRNAGLYPEIKDPAWHRSEGKDPGGALLALLARHGYSEATDNVYVQCFDPAELKRLRFGLGTRLRLVQLVEAEGEAGIDYEPMLTPGGLAEIARYAQGIGPHLGRVVRQVSPDGKPRVTALVRDAHARGLVVHPWTFRRDALPPGFATFDRLLAAFVRDAHIDGLFTDHPDDVIAFLRLRE